MTKRQRSMCAFGAAAALTLVACSGGGNGGTSSASTIDLSPVPVTAGVPTSSAATTAAPTADTTTTVQPAPTGWTIDTSTCPDRARAEQPITGTVKVGSVMPLSGGPAAAFGPIRAGFELYIKMASDKGLLPGYTISADIRDDQYDATQTSAIVDGAITDGVDIFSGIIGSPDNLAVRDTLNHQCIPQLEALTGSPAWGQIADFPWTTGALVPYDVEASIYATKLKELKPGAKVALYYVNSELGKAYVDEFKKQAGLLGLEVVDEQTIEPNVYDQPVTQVGSIAGKLPDAIIAIPLGLQCPAFLTELANAKAQNAAWVPLVFITNTCASKLFFGLAGAAAEGVYTSNNLVDVNDPKNATNPGVKAFIDAYSAANLGGDPGVIEAGWSVGETTVAILNAALKTGTLSRKSIIEAARNLTFTPSLARQSANSQAVQYKMKGAEDPFAFQTLQVLQWSGASQTFTEIGDPITGFES
ncbi:MAG: ABC transporter substrate-binding protein [Ilumatobacteraceae bacterium]|nr:ABC transporter substrate-binding protein [Ilumatobacteraceae bacterium]